MTFHHHRGQRKTRIRWIPQIRWLGAISLAAITGSIVTLGIANPAVFSLGSLRSPEPMEMPPSVTSATTPIVAAKFNPPVQSGVVETVKRVEPAVVGIVNFRRVSDILTQQSKLQPNDVGSGVLIGKTEKYGYFVTNNHVVQGAAKVEVVLKRGRHITAVVMGTDPYTDLAVVRVAARDVNGITPVPFANSTQLQVGEPAIAIGSPMGLDFEDSVTAGIVSAKSRIMPVEQPNDPQHNVLNYQTVIQTDAAINPGNSGGPLLNLNGEIIGINSSKIVDATVEGMGFAIPSNDVQNIASQIMRTGHAVHPSIGIEGVSLTTIPEEWWPDVPVDYGVWVRSVLSPQTREGGLEPQDVIVGYNEKTVRTMADLRTYLFESKPGDRIILKVYRNNKEINLTIKLGAMESPNTAVQKTDIQNFDEGDNSFFSFPSSLW